MKALQILAEREIAFRDIDPPAPGPDDLLLRVRALSLNHIDVWGARGMAFAKRLFPISVGAEAACEVIESGHGFRAGERVVPYAAYICGACRFCRRGQENLCENPLGVRGFHVSGFGQEIVTHPARLCVRIPDAVTWSDAACVAVAYATVEHMLFDNAALEQGETILIHAGGSGIGSIAIRIAKSLGCTVIATVGSDEKAEKARALGADHVINYRTERFEGVVRKLTAKRGVDVVFEHVGAETWNGSLLCLRRGGRLVTCGATSGPSASLNLMQLFQQQYRIIGSFGSPLSALGRALARISSGVRPVIDSEYPLERALEGIARLESRAVFGKLLLRMPAAGGAPAKEAR
ncbi:MAG TPA: zinc-binding dehydrogenase [Acetobacteraceae bacterium]|nr:zinc-binding dehydrogenase [Acetobacteraceae bacterium]